ncbi:MAG: hypothetical protein ACK4FB_07855 [Brevundimonas sp.]|uniref:hypothetical protein n=1 Tax=Brevundimonas sp. TaxID=1871086 RepID=UPI00391B8C76
MTNTIARLIWRYRLVRIMRRGGFGWGLPSAWAYSGALREMAEDKTCFDTVPPPGEVLAVDMQHWED